MAYLRVKLVLTNDIIEVSNICIKYQTHLPSLVVSRVEGILRKFLLHLQEHPEELSQAAFKGKITQIKLAPNNAVKQVLKSLKQNTPEITFLRIVYLGELIDGDFDEYEEV